MLSDKAEKDLWAQGYEEGFSVGVEGGEHPESDNPSIYEAGVSTGYQHGTAWKMFFELGKEVGPNGFTGPDIDFEDYVELFIDAFTEGRYLQSTRDGFVKQAIERGKHAGYRAGVSQGEHKQFITPDNAHSWTPFYCMEIVGPMTREEYVCAYREGYETTFFDGMKDGSPE